MPYLLCVELPDVPGSLGRVAAAIGEAGGDIEAIEIVEHRRDGTAVDDVLLETAPGVMPDSLVSACNQLDGVQVLWVSRYGAGGNLFLDLEAVETLSGVGPAVRRKLGRLGIATVGDVLAHRPRRYESPAEERTIAELFGDEEAVLDVVVRRASARRRGRLHILTAHVTDATGEIRAGLNGCSYGSRPGSPARSTLSRRRGGWPDWSDVRSIRRGDAG